MDSSPLHFHQLICKNLRRRPLRSGLTVGGAAIAVAAVVALVSLAEWFERSSLDEYRNRGVDLVVVRRGVAEALSSNLSDQLEERLRGLADVADVAGSLNDLALLGDDSAVGVPLRGWQAGSFAFQGLRITAGRALGAEDRHTVLLGVSLAESLHKQIGDEVEIEGSIFVVVGLFDSQNVMENGWAIMPLAELQSLMDRDGQVTEFLVRLQADRASDAQIQACRTTIESLANGNDRSLGLAALQTQDFVSGNARVRLAHALTWLTSVIAIAVGSVGVLNTMLMSLLERTQELSILRALGWRPGRVARMILGESLLLSLAGLAAGSLGAGLLLAGLGHLPWAHGLIHAQVSAGGATAGCCCALLFGGIGGGFPAWLAARISPAEALRYE